MNILTISGSSRSHSANVKLLNTFPGLFPNLTFKRYATLHHLPLFSADVDEAPWPEEVNRWRTAVANTDGLIICTPEYIHNMPALVKNALEWLTSSGELMHKPVLPLTFTPHPPRGEKAMQSLLWSLQALQARIVGQLDLYQSDISIVNNEIKIDGEMKEILNEAIHFLTT